MTTLKKNSQFSFRTNDKLLEEAKRIVNSEDFDMSSVMNAVLVKIVETLNVPADLVDDKAKRREKIIDELYAEIDKGYHSYKTGKVKSMDEVFAKYDL
jgi:antitoxin component of RelBE/YafQ-DinJ toxin-antitoxin module